MNHRTLLRALSSLAIGLICASLRAESTLPDIGQSAATIMTPAQERRTGATVVRNIRQAGGIVDDPLINEYLNQLGYRLLANTENPDHHTFQFFLVNDNGINAFALPGGFIGLNYGLIVRTDTESELASVVAHEIAHVTQRHHARAFENTGDTQIPVLAGILAAIILGSKGNEIGQAALASAAAGTVQQQINFTRHNEEEADRIGIQMLAKAEMDAQDMASFFDKLDKYSRLQGNQVPDFLRTHPVNTQRIADAYGRASNLPKFYQKDNTQYKLVKARISALTTSDVQSEILNYQTKLKNTPGTSPPEERYGYALLLIQAGKHESAYKEIQALLKQDPHRIAYLLALADIYIKSNQPQLAIKTYQSALKIYPNNSAITHDYTAALLQNKQAEKAKAVLLQFMKSHVVSPAFHQFLAQAEAMLHNDAASHESMAEYYYLNGQLHQAAEQIEIALKSKALDFYALSRLESKLSSYKQEINAIPQAKNSSQNI